MGWSVYLKNYIDKHGFSNIFYRVTSQNNKPIVKNLGIKIKSSDWDKRTLQINPKSDNALILNEKLNETINLIKTSWGLYESGTYKWEELRSRLQGEKSAKDVKSFIEEVMNWDDYSAVYGSALKYLNKDRLEFTDLTESTVDELFSYWKNLRSATVKNYLYHFGRIINEAHEKRLTSYKYVKKRKWRKKREQLNAKGNPYIEIGESEEFEKAIERAKTLYQIEALGFWLLMFNLRGLYPADLCTIHKHQGTLYLKKDFTLIPHQRSKTGEPMYIKYGELEQNLASKLRGYIELTHGKRINVKTGKEFTLSKEYRLSDNEKDGWFFNGYRKSDWDTFSKQLRKINFPTIKTARKTFESYALSLGISSEIRFKLLGHADPTIKKHYQKWDWIELDKQIHEAHDKVIKTYRSKILYNQLIYKANEILEDQGYDKVLFRKKQLYSLDR